MIPATHVEGIGGSAALDTSTFLSSDKARDPPNRGVVEPAGTPTSVFLSQPTSGFRKIALGPAQQSQYQMRNNPLEEGAMVVVV